MGTTNLLHGLERKFGHLTGELAAKVEEIERIEKLVATLPALRAEVDELRILIDHTAALLKHLKPAWEEQSVTPVKPFVHKLPIKLGECGRRGLAVLRRASEPMTAREVANAVLQEAGIFDADAQTRQRTTNTIQANLRAYRGTAVESDEHWPQKWRVIRSAA